MMSERPIFSETFCKNLCADDVAFNDLKMVVFLKAVYIAPGSTSQVVLSNNPFSSNDISISDVVGLSQSSHEIAKRGVETTPTACGDHVGGEGTADDLFNQNTS